MHKHDFKSLKGKKKGLFVTLIVILSVFLLSLTVSTIVGVQNKIKEGRYIGKDIEVKDTITVSDTGEVYVKPDLALTTFSVVTEAKTVEGAMSQNTEKMNAVIDSVKSKGVEDKDLKTTSFYIYPLYEWRESCVPPCPSGQRVLVGYEVRQSLQVKIRDMGKIGEIIQGATDAGTNQIGDLQFTVDNQDELKKQARGLAIEKAKVKAEELASQLGISLVRIISFNESGVVPYYYLYEAESMMGKGSGEELQIETGENKISVTVTITYEID